MLCIDQIIHFTDSINYRDLWFSVSTSKSLSISRTWALVQNSVMRNLNLRKVKIRSMGLLTLAKDNWKYNTMQSMTFCQNDLIRCLVFVGIIVLKRDKSILIEILVSGDTTAFCELHVYLKPLLHIGQYVILLIGIIPTVAFKFILIVLLSPTGVSLFIINIELYQHYISTLYLDGIINDNQYKVKDEY